MKKKTILTSILSLIMCFSLITGATFALFTSESNTNIAITSGKVEVVAEVTNWEMHSLNNINQATFEGEEVDRTSEGTFITGGTANYANGQINLVNIVPGDGVSFNIQVTNNSNVAIQYRTVISGENLSGGSFNLLDELDITIRESSYNGAVAENWATTSNTGVIDNIPVSIELPASANNDWMNKSVSLSIAVEAVQGNADTTPLGATVTEGNISVPSGETLIIGGGEPNDYKLIENSGDGVIINDVTYTGTAVVWGAGGPVTINGGKFTATAIVVADATSAPVIINGGEFIVDSIDASTGADVTINGGLFHCDPSGFVAEGHTVTDNGDGTWTVQ